MCDCEKKCWCWESASTIRKKICVDIAWYDPDDVCNNKLVIKYADSCQVILWIDNCETVTPVLPSAPTNGYVTDSGWWAYDCGNPILWWTASPTSWATYTIKEWATTIATWISGTTYTVTWATAWVHSYTVEAVNNIWSSSVLTINAFVTACIAAPWNVAGTISVYNAGTAVSYTCGLSFDVNFTDVSWATYYQLFEWATQIGSNSTTSNFVVTGQTVGNHTYTIKACNWVWCSTGTNFTVNVVACVTPSSAFITRDDFSYGNPAYTINNPWWETIIQTWMVLIWPYSNPWYSYYPDPTLTDTVQSYWTAMFRVFNPPMPPWGQCYTYRAFVTTNLWTTYWPSTSSSCQ